VNERIAAVSVAESCREKPSSSAICKRRSVGQQDAGAVTIDIGLAQDGAEAVIVGGIRSARQQFANIDRYFLC